MPLLEYTGNAVLSSLASGLTPTASTMTLTAGSGWPLGVSAQWTATIDQGGPNEEKVLCSTRTGNTVNIVQRGYDDTSAKEHEPGESVKHTISAAAMEEASLHVWDTGRDDHSQYLNVARHDVQARHGTSVIGDLAITTPKLADLAVSTGKIIDNAVTTPKIADLAITLAKLAASVYGTGLSANVAAANADGVSPNLARADHAHDDIFSDLRISLDDTNNTFTTSYAAQVPDLDVPAGNWLLLAFLRTSASINDGRKQHYARIYNVTDNAEVRESDRGVDNETGNTADIIPVWGVAQLATQKTFRLEGKTSAVAGTQFGSNAVLLAARFAHMTVVP